MAGGYIGLFAANHIDIFMKQGDVYNPMRDALPFHISFRRTTYKGILDNTIPSKKYLYMLLSAAAAVFLFFLFWYFKIIYGNYKRRKNRRRW